MSEDMYNEEVGLEGADFDEAAPLQADAAEDIEEAYDDEGAEEEDSEDYSEDASYDEDTDEGEQVSDEELDRIADTAIAALKDVLKYFDVGDITIDEYEGDEGELILDVTGKDLAVLIGRHGRTLDALQFLISAITVRKIGYRFPVIVDVEGYKNRQRQKLERLAKSIADKAASQQRSVKMRPMTPYERRIIHIALRDDPRVETASEGEGSARHVVVLPIQ
jgi:spoIIIJ-associated protein